ncbi:hypothetical protein HN51_004795 [Arachis hypogaea]
MNAKSIYRSDPSSLHLLLYLEPLSIAFETLQAILVHGFQFLDIWLPHSAYNSSDYQMPKLFNTLTAVSTSLGFSCIRSFGKGHSPHPSLESFEDEKECISISSDEDETK